MKSSIAVLILFFAGSLFASTAEQLPAVKTGGSYELQLPVAMNPGASWPFAFRAKAGTSLPPGFSLDPNSAVLKTTSAGTAGTYTFDIEAFQDSTVVGVASYAIEITAGAPVFRPAKAAAAGGAGNAVQPRILTQTREGTDTVIVAATPTKDGNTTTVELTVNESPVALADPNGSSQTDENGRVTLKLAEPLDAGDTVEATQLINGLTPTANDKSKAVDALDVGNWGRARAYFTAGILSSADDNNFSKQNLFASFLLDKMHRAAVTRWGWGIHSYFETRLTAVPVTAQASGTTGAMAGGTTPAQLDTFLSSQKAAVLTGGLYFPFISSTWQHKGTENAFYFAPLFKAGVQNPIGSLDPTTTSSTSTGSGTSTTTTTAVQPVAINGGRLYNFFGFGMRMGHVAHYSDPDLNPDSISHIDLVWGKYSNLEVFRGVDTSGNPIGRTRLGRLAAEGLLKVPNTILYIGFSANVGFSPAPLVKGGQVQAAKDDLRFLFGTKFDVAKLVSKLSK